MTDILTEQWVNTAFGIFVGILVTVVVGYVFKSRPGLAAKTNSLELVGPNAVLPNEISFLYRGSPVPKVTLSKIALWNSGNATVRGSDIVSREPLRVVLTGGATILEPAVLVRTRAANDVTFSVREVEDDPASSRNELVIGFDFLDPGDGAVIQLIHTGTDKIGVTGTVRGVPRGVRVVGTPRPTAPQPQAVTSRGTIRSVAGAVFLVGLALPVLKALGGLSTGQAAMTWREAMVGGGLLVAVGALLLFLSRNFPPGPLTTQIGSSASSQLRK